MFGNIYVEIAHYYNDYEKLPTLKTREILHQQHAGAFL